MSLYSKFKGWKEKHKVLCLLALYFLALAAFIVLFKWYTGIFISERLEKLALAIICGALSGWLIVVLFQHFMPDGTRAFYELAMLFLYPSTIIIMSLLLTAAATMTVVFIKPYFNNGSIPTSIITGVIASGIMMVFTEFCKNYDNNKKRTAILNDYFSVLKCYDDDIDLNKKRIEKKCDTADYKLFCMEEIISIVEENNQESNDDIYKYSNVEIQAIAWEILDYKDVFIDSLKIHSDLLYREEIEYLNNIMDGFDTLSKYCVINCNVERRMLELEKLNSNKVNQYLNLISRKIRKELTVQEDKSYYDVLYNLSHINESMIIAGIVIVLIYIDLNIKALQRHVGIITDEEFHHFRHMHRKLFNEISK